MEQLQETIFQLQSKISPVLFYGRDEANISLIENYFQIRIIPRGSKIKLIGPAKDVDVVFQVLTDIENIIDKKKEITTRDILTAIQIHKSIEQPKIETIAEANLNIEELSVQTVSKLIKAKTEGQEKLLKAIASNDLVFAIGPAGTGKTYLSVAMAVHCLKNGLVKKIILSRPAVEAGESLGFLPGDFKEKIDPYLRPLYDALSEMLPKESLKKYFEYETIEVIPLAYMRGRTLNNAFVILDEAQNSTFIQLKMFLTRLGLNTKAVVTGDVTQIDLSTNKDSGLTSSFNVLKGIKGIEFVYLSNQDVVRHSLVKEIIDAYDQYAKTNSRQNKNNQK